MGKDGSYDVIHRGEYMERVIPGKWLFIQRAKEYCGGWWFGRGYDDCFMLEFDKPTSLGKGSITFWLTAGFSNFLPLTTSLS